MDPLQNVAAMFSVGQGMANLGGSNLGIASMDVGNNVGGGGHRPEMGYQMRSHHLVRPNNPLGVRRRAPQVVEWDLNLYQRSECLANVPNVINRLRLVLVKCTCSFIWAKIIIPIVSGRRNSLESSTDSSVE